jgi:hypothetical protein
MNSKITIFLALALSALGSGCVGTGPNTQRGAVGGAALGALAGGIIGNNSGSHNGASGALIGAIAGGIAGGTLGNSVDQQNGTIYRSEADATTNVMVADPPPLPAPPVEVVTGQPGPAAVWVGGYWVYTTGGYAWARGRWEVPPPYCRAYITPHWRHRRGGYVYVRGYWH